MNKGCRRHQDAVVRHEFRGLARCSRGGLWGRKTMPAHSLRGRLAVTSDGAFPTAAASPMDARIVSRVPRAGRLTPPAPVPPRTDLSSLALLRAARDNTLKTWPARAYEDLVVHRRLFGKNCYLVNDPVAVRHILSEDGAVYERPISVRRIIFPFARGGLGRRRRKRAAASPPHAGAGLHAPSGGAAAAALHRGEHGDARPARRRRPVQSRRDPRARHPRRGRPRALLGALGRSGRTHGGTAPRLFRPRGAWHAVGRARPVPGRQRDRLMAIRQRPRRPRPAMGSGGGRHHQRAPRFGAGR